MKMTELKVGMTVGLVEYRGRDNLQSAKEAKVVELHPMTSGRRWNRTASSATVELWHTHTQTFATEEEAKQRYDEIPEPKRNMKITKRDRSQYYVPQQPWHLEFEYLRTTKQTISKLFPWDECKEAIETAARFAEEARIRREQQEREDAEKRRLHAIEQERRTAAIKAEDAIIRQGFLDAFASTGIAGDIQVSISGDEGKRYCSNIIVPPSVFLTLTMAVR